MYSHVDRFSLASNAGLCRDKSSREWFGLVGGITTWKALSQKGPPEDRYTPREMVTMVMGMFVQCINNTQVHFIAVIGFV